MESESPKWGKSWFTNEVMVLSDNFFCTAFQKEVNFNVTSDCDIAQSRSSVVIKLYHWRLSLSISEEHSKILARFSRISGLYK